MAVRPDFTLYDRHGRLAAIIEAKTKLGTSSRWAAEFRQNLLAHEAFRHAPFFLLVTPERLYLWEESLRAEGAEPNLVPPDHEIDARPLFKRYLERTELNLEDVSGQTFELIVMSWLGDLILQLPNVSRQEELEASGLPQLAKDGRIYPAAA